MHKKIKQLCPSLNFNTYLMFTDIFKKFNKILNGISVLVTIICFIHNYYWRYYWYIGKGNVKTILWISSIPGMPLAQGEDPWGCPGLPSLKMGQKLGLTTRETRLSQDPQWHWGRNSQKARNTVDLRCSLNWGRERQMREPRYKMKGPWSGILYKFRMNWFSVLCPTMPCPTQH